MTQGELDEFKDDLPGDDLDEKPQPRATVIKAKESHPLTFVGTYVDSGEPDEPA